MAQNIPWLNRGVQSASQPSAAAANGGYHALVIGNDRYRYLRPLRTAVNDATAVDGLLRGQYAFVTRVLYDATRNQILTALNEYRRTLPASSNRLIYYAGHVHHDPDTDKAYWLPVDAQPDNNANWISADDITSDVRAIPSLHVLIISDSCYSGALDREADAAITPRERGAYLQKLLQSKSRNLMSSGGDEPVADGGAPGHSVFANALMESLRRIDHDEFTASELFSRFVQPAVAGRSEQVPQYRVIRNSGHAFGDFVFSRKPVAHALNTAAPPAAVPDLLSPWPTLSNPTTTPANPVAQPRSSTPDQPKKNSFADILRTFGVQRFPVAYFRFTSGMAKPPVYDCSGWMTIEGDMLKYRAVTVSKAPTPLTGTYDTQSFDISLAQIKEIRKKESSDEAFQIVENIPILKTAITYEFHSLDDSMKQYQSSSSLISAIRAAMGKKLF